MVTKQSQRHKSGGESAIVYFWMVLMWAIFALSFYLILQKAAG